MNAIIGKIGSIFFFRNFNDQFSILILYCLFLSRYCVITIKNILCFAPSNISTFMYVILIFWYIIILKTTGQILFTIN